MTRLVESRKRFGCASHSGAGSDIAEGFCVRQFSKLKEGDSENVGVKY